MIEPQKRKKSWFWRAIWAVVTLVGVSGVIAILDYQEKQKDRERDRREWSERRYQEREQELRQRLTSSISGRVFDRQSHKPLGNIWVGYRSQGGFEHLATTSHDGRFVMELAIFDEGSFPIRLELTSPEWRGGTYQTNEYFHYGEKRSEVNIYVNTGIFR